MTPTEFTSTIRYRLYGGMVLVIFIMILTVITAIWNMNKAAFFMERANYSYDQLAKVTRLEADINRFLLSQIATSVNYKNRTNLVQVGPKEITRQLGNLQETIEKEAGFVESEKEAENEQEEYNSAIKLASVFIEMHLASSHEHKNFGQDNSAAMVRSFFRNVVDGKDKELSKIVIDIAEDERREVEEIRQRMLQQNQYLTNTSIILAFMTALGILFLSYLIWRAIVGPVNLLAEGAERIGAGELDHRIAIQRRDEFGLLAERFNHMAGQLSDQRALLRQANETLEQAVQERTRELKDTNDRLRSIDETRRKFFTNVSHELRTPVTVLLGEAEVALRAKDKDTSILQNAIERIAANGNFLRRRLNDLLNLARSDEGEIVLEKVDVEIGEIVEEAVDSATSYAEANDVQLHYQACGHICQVTGDPSWLKQCMLIIIDNAVKFSKPGDQVQVNVEAFKKQGDDYCRIEVQDQGPGIEGEALAHLFERYYQSKLGQGREGSSGLGLSIAKWIIDGHAGQVRAENPSEGGAKFIIELKQNN